MTYAERVLSILTDVKKQQQDQPAEKTEFILRANVRHGLRCLECGRKLSRIDSLPTSRRCPNGDCKTKYNITRGPTGVVLTKVK